MRYAARTKISGLAWKRGTVPFFLPRSRLRRQRAYGQSDRADANGFYRRKARRCQESVRKKAKAGSCRKKS